jgi:hypothetical protein
VTPRCTVCTHEQAAAINRELVRSVPVRDIAQRYGLNKSSVHHHGKTHLPHVVQDGMSLLEEKEEEKMRVALDVVGQLKAANEAVWEVFNEAKDEGNRADRLWAVDRIQKQLVLQAKLLGDIGGFKTQVNILIAPQVQQVILSALDPYPQARVAVAEALRGIEAPEIIEEVRD